MDVQREQQLRAALNELELARRNAQEAEHAWQAEFKRLLQARPRSLVLDAARIAALGLRPEDLVGL